MMRSLVETVGLSNAETAAMKREAYHRNLMKSEL
jgi:hypothetical protein